MFEAGGELLDDLVVVFLFFGVGAAVGGLKACEEEHA